MAKSYLDSLPIEMLEKIYKVAHQFNLVNVHDEMAKLYVYKTDNIISEKVIHKKILSSVISKKEDILQNTDHIVCIPDAVDFYKSAPDEAKVSVRKHSRYFSMNTVYTQCMVEYACIDQKLMIAVKPWGKALLHLGW